MSTITLRATKGTPLTNSEVDSNFSNLNSDKYESGNSPVFTDMQVNGTLKNSVAAVTQKPICTQPTFGLRRVGGHAGGLF